jgi:hypothetical protein
MHGDGSDHQHSPVRPVPLGGLAVGATLSGCVSQRQCHQEVPGQLRPASGHGRLEHWSAVAQEKCLGNPDWKFRAVVMVSKNPSGKRARDVLWAVACMAVRSLYRKADLISPNLRRLEPSRNLFLAGIR